MSLDGVWMHRSWIALPSHVGKRFARQFDNAQFTQPSPAEGLEQGPCGGAKTLRVSSTVSTAFDCLPPYLPPLSNAFLPSLLLYVDKRILESCEPTSINLDPEL
jgi:hypothetical protein